MYRRDRPRSGRWKQAWRRGLTHAQKPVTRESPGRFTWQTVFISALISQLSISVISSTQRDNGRTTPCSWERWYPESKWHRRHVDASKALPAQHPQGISCELAAAFSTAAAEDTRIQPNLFSPVFLNDHFKVTSYREKKRCSWIPYSNFSNSPICLLGQRKKWWEDQGRGEDQRSGEDHWGPPAATLVAEQFLKPFLPTTADLQPAGWLLFSRRKYSAPWRHRADSLDIQLATAWRRRQARGRQRGWSSIPHREGALPMHPIPAQEEITHPAATRGLAHTLEPGRRLQLQTRCPGCCFQKAPGTTGSHTPECQVTLWKWSWEWDLRLPSVVIPCLSKIYLFFKQDWNNFKNFIHCHYSIATKKMNSAIHYPDSSYPMDG